MVLQLFISHSMLNCHCITIGTDMCTTIPIKYRNNDTYNSVLSYVFIKSAYIITLLVMHILIIYCI